MPQDLLDMNEKAHAMEPSFFLHVHVSTVDYGKLLVLYERILFLPFILQQSVFTLRSLLNVHVHKAKCRRTLGHPLMKRFLVA